MAAEARLSPLCGSSESTKRRCVRVSRWPTMSRAEPAEGGSWSRRSTSPSSTPHRPGRCCSRCAPRGSTHRPEGLQRVGRRRSVDAADAARLRLGRRRPRGGRRSGRSHRQPALFPARPSRGCAPPGGGSHNRQARSFRRDPPFGGRSQTLLTKKRMVRRMSVPTTETSSEPKHPSRFEKKANT